jgi:hypothetical protein
VDEDQYLFSLPAAKKKTTTVEASRYEGMITSSVVLRAFKPGAPLTFNLFEASSSASSLNDF